MKTEILALTPRLEPALRCLAANLDAKVAVVAAKFKVAPPMLWAWLGAFNHGRPHPATSTIDNCLAQLSRPASLPPLIRPRPRVLCVKNLMTFAPKRPLPEFAPPNDATSTAREAAGAELRTNTEPAAAGNGDASLPT